MFFSIQVYAGLPLSSCIRAVEFSQATSITGPESRTSGEKSGGFPRYRHRIPPAIPQPVHFSHERNPAP